MIKTLQYGSAYTLVHTILHDEKLKTIITFIWNIVQCYNDMAPQYGLACTLVRMILNDEKNLKIL